MNVVNFKIQYDTMKRAFNFNPGPCGLPDAVMDKARQEFLCYRDEQASVMEISHRGIAFMEVYERASHTLRELLNISDDYAVLFLSGGATGQAAAVPMNLLPDNQQTAAYMITGYWSERAAQEARKYCQMHIVADSKDNNYTNLPSQIEASPQAKYLHYADNETIHGVEFPTPPSSAAPLVADMSSNILSRPFNINDYGIVYAGAQKNLGAAGITIVIVRQSLINPCLQTPLVWDYRLQIESESMANTPPTYPIYLTALVLEWIRDSGGVEAMAKCADEKSRRLYGCIDNSDFYHNTVSPSCRSRMNVPFFLPDEKLTTDFCKARAKTI